jgi:hypothetical protein
VKASFACSFRLTLATNNFMPCISSVPAGFWKLIPTKRD